MNDEDILNVVNYHYPKCVGVIWTGSSLNNTVNNQSDIDVVIVDEQFSVISPIVIVIKGKRFDFTQIPLSNLENILFDELYDPKGILITMISNGKIIKDTKNMLLKQIQQKVSLACSNFQTINEKAYENFVHELKKIQPQFNKLLEYKEAFLLLNEFVFQCSQAEVFRHSNWSYNGKHKPRFLISKNAHFIERLIEVAGFSKLKEGYNDLSSISAYIDFYLSEPFRFNTENYVKDKLVLDLTYENISITDFIHSILDDVLADPILQHCYSYFYLSPKQSFRIYKKYICIVFNISPSYSRENVFTAFKKVLMSKSKNRISLSTLPTSIFDIQNPNSDFYYRFEHVAKSVSQVYIKYLRKDIIHDDERYYSIGLILLTFVSEKINLTQADLLKCNYYLSLRHTYTFKEQDSIKVPSELNLIRKRKYELLKKYYATHQEYVDKLISNGASLLYLNSKAQTPLYYSIVESLTSFLTSELNNLSELVNSNKLTISVLNDHFKIKDVRGALLYILTFEHLVRSLNINDSFSCLLLFTLNESQICIQNFS
ncbi:hypothetical protein HDC92_002954 [Pedobacter sp. AK017]|uniref:hypothetical protein n=1 Tax=Pedobacter sp. AK017 TaxID=2723073 RepID=UPI00160D9FFB|nr:hypothetical protein [Pedobacter sp. AK017]MBB5439267.1 hypothetical protein [Pedobacter sp. AK017]